MQEVWKNLDKKKIDEKLIPKGIKWTFTNVYCPNENGLAEASVKLVKTALFKIFRHGHLSYIDFSTAIASCEAIVNSRPLGYLREDSEELLPVTPADLVLGRQLLNIPEDQRKLNTKSKDVTRMMRHRSKLIESFWKRFSHEYLERLSFYRQWRENKVSELKIGTVVQITDKITPRGKFLLGVVTELHHGRDGNIRAATIRLGPGRFTRRNIRQLSLFEQGPDYNQAESDSNESD